MIPLAPVQNAVNNAKPPTAGAVGAPPPLMRPGAAPLSQAAPVGAPAPQTMPLAQPIGAPPLQSAAQAPSQAGAMSHILTRMASGNPSNPWMAPSAAPTPSAPIPLAAGGQNYANVSNIAPGGATDYTNKTITPGAGVDRLALAKSNFQNFKDSTEPEYQAALREAGQSGAGAGQIGSGMLRGRLGDIGLARSRDLQAAENANVNNATEGSIGDAYKNIGIAQQQQGFQAGRQDTAFGQGVTQAELNDNLLNSDFGRNATRLQLGDSGNPSDVGLALSGYYGNQAGQSGAAAADLLKSSYLNKALQPKAA